VATNIFASQGFIKNNTVLSRLTLSGENVRSVASRMVLWPGALRMIGERPLLGHGLDTFNLVYPRYLDPAIFDFENLSSAPDRAHNELLDLAVAAGLLGLVFYLLLLGLLTRMVMNYITEQPRAGDLLLVLGPFLGIASLFFANQFSFSVTLMWFFFWLHLALLAFLLSPKQRHTIHLTSLYHMMVRMGVFTIVIIGIGALGYSTIVTPALAEVGFRNGRVAHNAEQTASAFAHYHEAVDRAPYQRQYYYWLAEAALAQNNQDMLAEAMRLIQDLPRIAGEHFDVLLYRARLLSSLDGPPVLDAFDDVIAHSPNNPRTYLYAGHAYFEAARHQEAIDMYIAYLRLVPDLWRWKTHLEERLPEEREKYRIFYKLNPDFDEVFERLSYAYGQIGDSEKAAFYQYYSN
jgi:tetratricopeptide (TPR) repeat protein